MKRGLPAAAVLAGGISRHGASCSCPYCVPPVIPSAYARPIAEVAMDDIDDAGVLQPPLPPDDAISQAFSKARETIAELEAKRVEHVGGEWSPSQFARRSA